MAKDFTKNPAMQFISSNINGITDDSAPAEQPNVAPVQAERLEMSEKTALLLLLNENKTKRLNLVLQPTIHKMAVEKAKEQGQSLNNFIINAIIKALEG